MKLILTSLLFCSVAHSAEILSADLYCDDTKTIVKALREDYEEAPIIMGKATDVAGSVMSLWINPKTKSWSIIATKDNTSCIVGVGGEFTLLSSNPKSKINYY